MLAHTRWSPAQDARREFPFALDPEASSRLATSIETASSALGESIGRGEVDRACDPAQLSPPNRAHAAQRAGAMIISKVSFKGHQGRPSGRDQQEAAATCFVY